MAVTLARSLVLANFGIAIAARMPMITTTISSSISVKARRRAVGIQGPLAAAPPSGDDGGAAGRAAAVARDALDRARLAAAARTQPGQERGVDVVDDAHHRPRRPLARQRVRRPVARDVAVVAPAPEAAA